MKQVSKFSSSSYLYVADISFIIFGMALLFGCSQIAIPIQPVPVTLQTVGVLFIILTYDSKKALQTILAYVLLGVSGAPMFSGYRSGLAVILGPTGGYILGFILAALMAIPLKKSLDSYSSILQAFVFATIITFVIMISGLFWLSIQVGLTKAIEVGLIPFIIPGLIKSGILSLILRSIGYFRTGQ